MLKRFKNLVSKLFGNIPASPPAQGKPQYGDKVGNVTIERYAQLVKHTEYKPGESYRLGEGIVTVHADKNSMYMALLKVDDTRFMKHEGLTKRAVDLMLMTPEEIQELKITEWLEKGKGRHRILRGLEGKYWTKVKNLFRRTDYKTLAAGPDGTNPKYQEELKEAFKAVTGLEETNKVKIKEKVKV